MSKKKLLSELKELKDKYYKRGEESDALRDGKGMYWGGVISAFNEVITLVEKQEEEPVSDDLEKAAQQYAKYTAAPQSDTAYHFEAGANWQKEQFEKNRLAACERQTREEAEREQDFVMSIIENEHRQPTFSDAIEYGMRVQKQQMMKDAIDCVIEYNNPSNPYLIAENSNIESYIKDLGFETGDKVKLIIVKEEEP